MRPDRLGIRIPRAGMPMSLTVRSCKANCLSIAAWSIPDGATGSCFKLNGNYGSSTELIRFLSCRCVVGWNNGNYSYCAVIEKLIYCKRTNEGPSGCGSGCEAVHTLKRTFGPLNLPVGSIYGEADKKRRYLSQANRITQAKLIPGEQQF